MQNKSRTFYTKLFKRKALLRLVRGEKPCNILMSESYTIDEIEKNKKYATKLINKWRKEIYKNKTTLNITTHKFDAIDLSFEVDLIMYITDSINDEVQRIIESRFKNILTKKKAKFRVKTAKRSINLF